MGTEPSLLDDWISNGNIYLNNDKNPAHKLPLTKNIYFHKKEWQHHEHGL
jgi:hypothetical protein